MDTINKTEHAHGPLCPLTQKPCLDAQCELWDDEWDMCALRPENLYFKIREAVTDAAVEIIRAYRRAD